MGPTRSDFVQRRHTRGPACTFLQAAAFTAALLSPSLRAEVDLDRVVQCMRDNLPKTLHADVSLIALDRAGHSQELLGTLSAESSADQGHRLLWQLRSPATLAGAAVLTRDDPQGTHSFLYLPSLGRVRRIEQADREGRMFGTDLSYGDAQRIASVFTEGALTVLGETRYGQRAAWKLAATAAPGTTGIDRIDITIDQQSCVTVQADLLREDVVQKRWSVSADALGRSGRYWYAGSGIMRDLQQGTETRVRLTAVSTDQSFPDTTFDPQRFYRSH